MAGVLYKIRVVDPTTRAEMLEQESPEGLKAISVGLRLKGGGTRESAIQRIQEALEQEARACDPSSATGRIVHAMGKVADLGKATKWLTQNYKVDDLKALCIELRLSKTGNKKVLAERITAEAMELWKVQASRTAEGSIAAAPVEAAHEAAAVEEVAVLEVAVPDVVSVEEAAEEPAPTHTARSRSRRSRPAEVEQFFRDSAEEPEEASGFSDSHSQVMQSTGPPAVEPAELQQQSTPSSTHWEPASQPRHLQSETTYEENGQKDPLPRRSTVPLEQPAWQEAQYRDAPVVGDRQLRDCPEEAVSAEGSWVQASNGVQIGGTWDVRSGTHLPPQAEERYRMADSQDAANRNSLIPGVYDSSEDDDVVKTEPIPDKEEAQLEKRHRRFVERRMKLVGYLAEEVANAYGGYKNNYIADMNKMLAGASDRAREQYLSDKLEEQTPAMLTQRVPEVLGPTCQAPEFGAWHPEPVQHEMQMVGELGPARLAWCKWWDMNTGCGELVDLDDQSSVAVVSAALTTGANVSPKLKYLTHGEFVEYRRVDQGTGQAARGLLVRGLRGWPLMCEVDGSRALPAGN